MKSITKYFTAAIAAVLFFHVCTVEAQNGSDKINIRMENPEDALDIDISNGIWIADGVAIITYGDLVARGYNLYYDEKTNVASMKGNPAVTASVGQDTQAELGRIAFDVGSQQLFASGGCRINISNASGTARLVTENVLIKTDEKWMRADGGVEMKYSPPGSADGKYPETEGKDDVEAPGDATGGIKNISDLGDFTITSGPVYYEMETGTMNASGPVRIEFEAGFIEAGFVKGNTESRSFELGGGVEGEAGITRFRADTSEIDLEAEEMTVSGDVEVAQARDGHRMSSSASSVWIRFARDDMRMRAFGINTQMDLEQKEKKNGENEQNVPKGDSP